MFFHHLQLFSLRSYQVKSNQFPPDEVLFPRQTGLESAIIYIAQENLELEIFLLQSPKCWGCPCITHIAMLFSCLFDQNLGCPNGRTLSSPLLLAVSSACLQGKFRKDHTVKQSDVGLTLNLDLSSTTYVVFSFLVEN